MVETIITDINNITPENYLQSFPLLKRLTQQALQIIPDETKYSGQRTALEEVISIIDKVGSAEGENFKSWMFHVFRNKKEHALDALRICIKKEHSPYLYSY